MATRLSALDAAYLRQESDSNPMSNAGVAVLDPSTRDGGLSFADVRAVFARRLPLLPRLRQRLAAVPYGAGRPLWVDDDDFDLDWHLRRVVLPAPGDARRLRELVEEVHPRRLDRRRPLWECYAVEGLAGGRVALVVRFHHALADGMSAMFLAGALLDEDLVRRAGAAERDRRPEPAPGPADLLATALAEQQAVPGRLAAAAGDLLADPERLRESGARLRRALASLPPPESFTDGPFNVAVGRERRVAWTTVPARALREVARAAGVTSSDAVLGVVGAALGHLLALRGEQRQSLRVLLPIADAAADQRAGFGNQGSCVLIDLPVGPVDPLARLRLVAAETQRVRDAGQRLVASTLRGLWEALPASVDPLVTAAGQAQRVHCHLVVSYMRGTRRQLSFDGARHIATVPVPPLAPRLALTVAVARLGDTVAFGFTGDWAAVADIDRLPEGVSVALGQLRTAAA